MAGHRHDAMQTNQNLGNTLGSRSAVRQTHFFRKYESGNTMKALLGTPNLSWDVTRKQGAYEGRIEDPYAASPVREVTGGVGTSQKVNSKILEHKAAAKVQHEDYQDWLEGKFFDMCEGKQFNVQHSLTVWWTFGFCYCTRSQASEGKRWT
ncbi:unnamed protein product [Durusdinium trenchii]|uniref:Uncharacterized protein n=1 Tax=Durusdinium trenchii TaxID=1381693 RepID=A0ABP0RIL9_9DINO